MISPPWLPAKAYRAPHAPPDLELVRWRDWVREGYPRTAAWASKTEGDGALLDPVATIRALESRKLGKAELRLLADDRYWMAPAQTVRVLADA